ncbi:hypothetical protein NYZ99_09995 [Maribacter litopenaei]|uniref:PIN domain-containing protein n=1 Tax=Maribacter litopenaei TaxID=2976127 RepID=A0ABY5YED7_9FLAO|nr:hypothetical protein [Maribacter litopenaei]UWX56480.1 hypothetical protein NYZ99_09995 [Maribacter litopenaei]
MVKTRLKIIYQKEKPRVVCDTNVWFQISAGKYSSPEDYELSPTAFSLIELATSQVMVELPKFYQNTVRIIYDNGGSIIPENPFDFVLQNQFKDYTSGESPNLFKILKDFSELLSREIKEDDLIDEEIKTKVIKECQGQRTITKELAEIGNQDLIELRKNINTSIGKKEHLKIDGSEINRQMFKSFINDYTETRKYSVDWDKFDWTKIELFMIVTESYFKKLETTKGMKIQPNDIVDWFNLLYVQPDDKYLTFEKRWRNFIMSNEESKKYLLK